MAQATWLDGRFVVSGLPAAVDAGGLRAAVRVVNGGERRSASKADRLRHCRLAPVAMGAAILRRGMARWLSMAAGAAVGSVTLAVVVVGGIWPWHGRCPTRSRVKRAVRTVRSAAASADQSPSTPTWSRCR